MHKRKHHSHPSHKHHAKKHKVGLEPALNPFQYLNTPSPGGSSVGPPRPGPAPPKPPGPPPPKPPVPPPAPPKKDDTPWYDDPHFQDFLSGLKYTGMGLGGAVGLYALHKGFQVAKQQYADYKLRRSMGQRLRNNGNEGTEMTSRNRNLNEPFRDVPQLHGNPKAEGIFKRIYSSFKEGISRFAKSTPVDYAKKNDDLKTQDDLKTPLLNNEYKSPSRQLGEAVGKDINASETLRQRKGYSLLSEAHPSDFSGSQKDVHRLFKDSSASVPTASSENDFFKDMGMKGFLKSSKSASDYFKTSQHAIGKAAENEGKRLGGLTSEPDPPLKLPEAPKSSWWGKAASFGNSLWSNIADVADVFRPSGGDGYSLLSSEPVGIDIPRSFPTPSGSGGGSDFNGGGGTGNADDNKGGSAEPEPEPPHVFGASSPVAPLATSSVLTAPPVQIPNSSQGTIIPVQSGDAAAAANVGLPNEEPPPPPTKEWYDTLKDNVINGGEQMLPYLAFMMMFG